MRITRPRLHFPSPALILSCAALFAALGGGAYAATQTSASKIHFTNATLKNGWAHGCCDSASPGYAKDALGVVHLRGSVAGGTNDTVAFVLPKGMRPKHSLFLPVYTETSNEGSLKITPSGDVIPYYGTDNTLYTSLDGISFVAGQ